MFDIGSFNTDFLINLELSFDVHKQKIVEEHLN